MVFNLSALWWIRIRGFWKLPDRREWLWGNLDLVLMGRDTLRKSLIQFSLYGWICVPFLLFGLRPNYGRGNGCNGGLLQKNLCQHSFLQCPWPSSRPLPTHASTGDSWILQNLAEFLRVSKLGAAWLGDLAQSPSWGYNQIHAGAVAIRRLLWGLTQNSQNFPS